MAPADFGRAAPRPSPVIVMADTSDSMSNDGKISVLNDAVDKMLGSLREMDFPGCEFQVSVIAFGGTEARLHIPPTPVRDVAWRPLATNGVTPMGSAFELARTLLEDETLVPKRSYRPNLVLVSDGIPTDDWRTSLKALEASPQAERAMRFAVGIGADVKLDVLRTFAGDEGQVVSADRVDGLIEFFDFVTYSVALTVERAPETQADLPTFVQYSETDVVDF